MPRGSPGAILEDMSALGDAEAAARVKSGADPDHAGFRTIYERYGLEVLRFLERLLKDRQGAEDALQETFVRLHKGMRGYDPARPLRPYVFSVARNVAIDVLRVRAKRERTEPLGEQVATAASAIEGASTNERREAVEEALSALAAEHRSILVLRHVHGLKLEEIADGLSCTVRTARNRLRAACVLLARELKRRGIVSGEVSS